MSKCMRACCACLPQRYVLAIYIVVGLICCYLERVSVNIAINEMTFRIKKDNKTSKGEYCPKDPSTVNKTQRYAEFHWDQQTQHHIISAIYVGYIGAHIPAGILADKLGAKHVMGTGILASSIIALSFPTLARISPYVFMIGRVFQGFGQGVMFPSMSALVSKWAPPNERSTMTGVVQSGVMIGNASGYIISGIVLSLFSGWEPLYYLCGIVGILWCCGWYTLCYSSPAKHPFITEKERDMIQTQIAETSKGKPKHIPWKSILTSGPFISVVLCNFGHAWALFTMINEMPVYMMKVLNFNVSKSGFFSATPHIAMIPTSIITGFVADWIIRRKYLRVTAIRRLFAVCGNILPIPFMLGASFAACDRTLVVLLFMGMMFFKGFAYSSTRVNPVDLSPNYAGVLMAIQNGIGAFAALLSPQFVPLFITGDGSIEEWRNVFIMSAFIMTLLSIPYAFLGSGEVQPWNNLEPTADDEEESSLEQSAPKPEETKN